MKNVVAIETEGKGSHLCDIRLWRDPSGGVKAELRYMIGGHVEGAGDNIIRRFETIAGWMEEGAEYLRQQGKVFDE